MRTASSLAIALAVAALAAACGPTNTTRQVGATPPVVTAPTVTYEVAGNDLSQANANAVAYCRQYNMGVMSQGVGRAANGNHIASYTCSGQVAVGFVNPAPGAVVVAPAQPGAVIVTPLR